MYNVLNKHALTGEEFELIYHVTKEFDAKETFIYIHKIKLAGLYNAGWLNCDNEYTVSEKGLALLSEVELLFVKQKKNAIEIPEERVREITDIFPDIKGGSGKRLRCNLSETASGLLWFRKNYPMYEWETIMQAARLYVVEQELENFKYTRRLKYFLRKMMQDRSWESDCAEYCERVKAGDLGDKISNHFKEKIV